MNFIDTVSSIASVYFSGAFRMEDWERYIDSCLPGAKELCKADLEECLGAGLSFERDYLPVLNAVYKNREAFAQAVASFRDVTAGLERKIQSVFGKTVEADVVLYLGLCSGAGWAVALGGRSTVLLGIEKILELNWGDRKSMETLIFHELGHLFHAQNGAPEKPPQEGGERFLWQLFSEGIAMVFEQELLGDPDYFHQDQNGWRLWCERHLALLARSFAADLPAMTFETQRYFGDWVRFEGMPDTGYFLGAKFLRHLLKQSAFSEILRFSIAEVEAGFEDFLSAVQSDRTMMQENS